MTRRTRYLPAMHSSGCSPNAEKASGSDTPRSYPSLRRSAQRLVRRRRFEALGERLAQAPQLASVGAREEHQREEPRREERREREVGDVPEDGRERTIARDELAPGADGAVPARQREGDGR